MIEWPLETPNAYLTYVRTMFRLAIRKLMWTAQPLGYMEEEYLHTFYRKSDPTLQRLCGLWRGLVKCLHTKVWICNHIQVAK